MNQGANPEPPVSSRHGKLVPYILFTSLVLNVVLSLVLLKWANMQLNTIASYALIGEIIFAVMVYRQRPRFGLNSTFYSTWLPLMFVFLGVEVVLTAGYFGFYIMSLADSQKAKALTESANNWPYFKETTIFSALWRLPAAVLTFIHINSGLPEEY